MAGKKRSNNAARKAQYAKRSAGIITADRKAAAAVRHTKLVAAEATKKAETSKLFEKVCAKYKLNSKGKYALKRLIGTINKSRLQAVLDNKLSNAKWFTKRLELIVPINEKTDKRIDTNAYTLIKSTQLGQFI